LFDKSICYDLGCSTGNLLIKLANFTNKKEIEFNGLEIERKMYVLAKENIKKNKIKNIRILNADIKKFKLKKNNLTNFVLHSSNSYTLPIDNKFLTKFSNL
jgi:tRNA (cmo5U34)-methyltransferase